MVRAPRLAARFGCGLAIFLLSCGEEATEPAPVPGDLAVSVVSPNGVEGAAVLQTVQEGIVDITSDVGQAHHWRAGDVSRIVVLLDAPGDIRFTLSVADLNRPPNLRVVEVADPDNRLRPLVVGYVVESEPVTRTEP